MSVQSDLKRLSGKTYKEPKGVRIPKTRYTSEPVESKEYPYVLGYTESEKRVFLGPMSSDVEAEEFANMLEDAEIFHFKTKSRPTAVAQVRAELKRQGRTFDDVLERQLHERGLIKELERTQ